LGKKVVEGFLPIARDDDGVGNILFAERAPRQFHVVSLSSMSKPRLIHEWTPQMMLRTQGKVKGGAVIHRRFRPDLTPVAVNNALYRARADARPG